MSYKKHLTWGQSQYPIIWNRNPYIWSDVYVIIEEAIKAGGGAALGDWQKKYPEKKRKLIKVLAIIDHENYKEEHYTNPDATLTVKDIQILEEYVKKQMNIEIQNKNNTEK